MTKEQRERLDNIISNIQDLYEEIEEESFLKLSKKELIMGDDIYHQEMNFLDNALIELDYIK